MSGEPRTGSCCCCVQHPHSSKIPQSQGHTLHKTPGNFLASGLHLPNASLPPLSLTTSCSHLFPCLNLHGAISSKKPSSSSTPSQLKGGPEPRTAVTTTISSGSHPLAAQGMVTDQPPQCPAHTHQPGQHSAGEDAAP